MFDFVCFVTGVVSLGKVIVNNILRVINMLKRVVLSLLCAKVLDEPRFRSVHEVLGMLLRCDLNITVSGVLTNHLRSII